MERNRRGEREPEVELRPRRADLRCAICHDETGLMRTCASCGTVAHVECRRGLGRCPTLQCREVSVFDGPVAAGFDRRSLARIVPGAGALVFGLGLLVNHCPAHLGWIWWMPAAMWFAFASICLVPPRSLPRAVPVVCLTTLGFVFLLPLTGYTLTSRVYDAAAENGVRDVIASGDELVALLSVLSIFVTWGVVVARQAANTDKAPVATSQRRNGKT